MASSDSPQGDCANDQENPQKITKIDPDGDLTLVVGRDRARFLVCSKALSRSAPFWKSCLYGPFRESKPATGQDWVVELPDDNPSGLHILLLLVHGLGHKLPPIDLKLAFEITVLSNKYDMTQSLWAIAKSWLQGLKPLPPSDFIDHTIVPQLRWLWVTKELGGSHQHSQAFAELSQMISATTDGDGHILLEPYRPSKILEKINLEGYDAEKEVMLLIAEDTKLAREKAMNRIQNILKRDIEVLQDEIRRFDSSKGCTGATICSFPKIKGSSVHFSKRRFCEYAMQAIVAKFSAEQDSPVKSLNDIGLSVEDYLGRVACFISRIEREIRLVSGHTECTPFNTEIPDQVDLSAETRRKWQAENFKAFQKKARVLGL